MKVQFLDLKAQYVTIKEEINDAIQKILDSCAFAGGPFVEEFEKNFAAFCGCKYSIGVGNGTDALWLALLAIGVGSGDEVITVPNTFIATCEAISMCGAKPVFVDINEESYTMEAALIEKVITKRTKAIIPVHLFGQMADMDPIMDIARRHNLFVIEDACQAHGAEYKGKRAGSVGELGCFSFYPGKNLGAYGEAGAIVTNNEQFNQRMRMLRDHGQSKKYFHDVIGWNARMDGIQAAVLNVKLNHLSKWNEARRTNAEYYNHFLNDMRAIKTPKVMKYNKHIYHVYAVRVQSRNSVIEHLKEKGIGCLIHYPVPVHLQQAYGTFGFKNGSYKISEMCSDELMSLPMYPELSRDQIEYVADSLKSACSELR